jgi:hypothetical protein
MTRHFTLPHNDQCNINHETPKLFGLRTFVLITKQEANEYIIVFMNLVGLTVRNYSSNINLFRDVLSSLDCYCAIHMDLSDDIQSFCLIITFLRIGDLDENFLVDCIVKRTTFEVLMSQVFIK